MDISSISHDQKEVGGRAVLTADEVGLVGGAVKVELDIPPHIFVPLVVGHYINTAVIFAPAAPVFLAAGAMRAFDSWAEPKLSTARKSN